MYLNNNFVWDKIFWCKIWNDNESAFHIIFDSSQVYISNFVEL